MEIMALLVKGNSSNFVFLERSPILRLFAIWVAVSFPCISRAILVQISYPGTLFKTRDQELSFGTQIYGILFIIDEDISSWRQEKKREVLWRSLYITEFAEQLTRTFKLLVIWTKTNDLGAQDPNLSFILWELGLGLRLGFEIKQYLFLGRECIN